MSMTISRVMSCVIICLVVMLPRRSSDLPEAWGTHILPYGLASDGVYIASAVTGGAVVSYTAVSPLPQKAAVSFLLHFPWSHLRRPLTDIPSPEARTFLETKSLAITYHTHVIYGRILTLEHEKVKNSTFSKASPIFYLTVFYGNQKHITL